MKVGAALVLLVGLAVSDAASQTLSLGRLFECGVKHTGIVRDDGSFGDTDATRLFKSTKQKFLFDEARATLRWGGTDNSWQYTIQQPGSDQNSLIATRYYEGLGSTVVEVLRIKTWVKSWPFLLFEQDTVYSGTCRPL